MKSNKYRIPKIVKIGSPDAETDDILFDAFVQNDILDEILDTRNHKSILLGRTGSGKSAIIRYIEENSDDVKRLVPEELSLRFLSNSTVLNYFKSINVNLNLFFKILWKHVFIVELLKLYFKDDYDKKVQSRWYHHLREKFLQKIGKIDPKKEKAINYLDRWTDEFWEDTEYRIRELTNKLTSDFTLGVGIRESVLNSTAQLREAIESGSVVDVKHKAESVIHDSQSKELAEIFHMMKTDLFSEHQKKFYIVIDDLDKEWIESSFRYDLIDAMVEVIKEFRQFNGVKIVISLRENLSDLLKLGIKHAGGQREKYKPLYANIKWTEKELQNLLDKRLNLVTEKHLDTKNAFYKMRRGGVTGFEYVLKRTYMRPRDLISFVNHALELAKSKTHLTKDIIYKAEIPYSNDRFEALEDEWRENYGDFAMVSSFLHNIRNGFKLKSLNEDSFEEIYVDDEIENKFKGPLLDFIIKWKTGNINNTVFFKRIIFLLYHIGIIGVKKGPTHPVVFFYDDLSIRREDISNNNKYYVHPSLYSYFNVIDLDQLPEED